jgi:hypothetical protein
LIENLIDLLNHIQYDRQEVLHPKENKNEEKFSLNRFLLEQHFQWDKEQNLIYHYSL